MEVTMLDTDDNHVVIGGGKSRAFTIATTAEFVTVLSDALYSNKELAVVREVMCNAWDAHITSKRTNQKITVTIDANKLSIRDYGFGISDDMIQEVYCTYGESTKRKESATTGGFGLGSKSPFALSDTFTVTSFYEGTKTVYAVSKGTEDSDGLPTLQDLVKVPTTESGLLVEIPITEDMGDKLAILAHNVAYYGEMFADITYDLRTTTVTPTDFGLKDSAIGYMLTKDTCAYDSIGDRFGRIYIQYGAVIYPLIEHEAYSEEFNLIRAILLKPNKHHKVTSAFAGNTLVIKAKDSTLSVAPSRETLSYNKYTVEEIKKLLEPIVKEFQKTNPKYVKESLDIEFDSILKPKLDTVDGIYNLYDFFHFYENRVIIHNKSKELSVKYLRTVEDIHAHFLSHKYSLGKQFSTYIIKKILAYFKKLNNPKFYKIVKIYFKKLKNYIHTPQSPSFNQIAYKIFLEDFYTNIGSEYLKYLYLEEHDCSSSHKSKFSNLRYYNYAKGEVFISYTKSATVSYIKHINDRRHWGSNDFMKNERIQNYSMICVPRTHLKRVNLDELVYKLESLGYKVREIYKDKLFQKDPPAKKAKEQEDKPKRSLKGWALLNECVTFGSVFDADKFTNANRIEDPDVVTYLSTKNYTKVFTDLRNNHILLLQHYFPKTVVVSSSATYDNVLRNTNAKRPMDALIGKLVEELKQPDTIEQLAYKRVLNKVNPKYEFCASIPDIAKEFGLRVPTGSKDYHWINLLADECLIRCPDYRKITDSIETKINDIISNLPNLKLIEEKEGNLNILRCWQKDFQNFSPDNQTLITEFIRTILKG